MRSQLFGFPIQTHLIYEAILECSLQQAHEITCQHIRKFEGLLQQLTHNHSATLGEPHALGIEVPLNSWDDATTTVVGQILEHHAYSDEMQRMQLLRQALAWMWPKFQTTAVAAQFLLAATLDSHTHISLQVGWNEGAAEEDVAFAREFVQLYFRYLKQLEVPWRSLILPTEPNQVPPKQYGPRLDTLQKLEVLRTVRERYKRGSTVTINRMAACDEANITLATVKKYEPILYDRWYDVTY